MTYEEVVEVFEEEDLKTKWEGDNTIQGLKILEKYFNPLIDSLITGANHDVLYSVDVEEAIKRGLTKEDVYALARLNWMIEDDCFQCFV
jgi:hypothetical protein